jgi:REP element-mobilizing transposase RayT
MPHTSTHNYLHIVFGTKERASSIPELLQPRLWAYMAGICNNYAIVAFAIGGMEDHVHLLWRLPPMLLLAKAVSVVKANSSRWMKEHCPKFAWQTGYGAFSVSKSNMAAVTRYIRDQKIHHRKMTFEEEYRALFKLHGDELE